MKSLLAKTDGSSRKVQTVGLGMAILLVGMSMVSLSHRGTAPNGKVSDKSASAQSASKPDPAKVQTAVGKLPLAFEPNQGQTGAQVKYIARASGYTAALTADGVALRVKGATDGLLQMRLRNAESNVKMTASDKQPGKSNYLFGNDKSKWILGVPHYGEVSYRDVYRGVDMVFSGSQHNLEYDFVVKPGADPKQIRMAYQGTSRFELNAAGDLELQTAAGRTVSHKPVVYQTVHGNRKLVAAEYALLAKNEAGFKLGAYDTSLPLVIDPTVTVVSYLGGTGDDQAFGVASGTPAQGFFLTGKTASLANAFTGLGGFPLNGALQATDNGGSLGPSGYDAFVSNLKPNAAPATGFYLAYSTYLGGSGDDVGTAIAVDSTGAAYVTGWTASVFTTGVGNIGFPGITAFPGGNIVAFLTKLSATGAAQTYSTAIGNASTTQSQAIALDATNNAYIGGITLAGATLSLPSVGIQGGLYGGGTSDGFVAEVGPTGTQLFTAYIGSLAADQVTGIAVDSKGSVYAAGTTSAGAPGSATPFPITNGGLYATAAGTNGFIVKIPAGFAKVTWSSTFGNGAETVTGVAVDGIGQAYISGSSASGNWGSTLSPFNLATAPAVPPALNTPASTPAGYPSPGAGNSAGYLLSLNPPASGVNFIDYGPTIFGAAGGTFNGVALDSNLVQAYVVGTASNYVNAASGLDTVVARFSSGGNGYSTVAGVGGPGTLIPSATNSGLVTIGGGGVDLGFAIAVNSADQAFIAGATSSAGGTPIQASTGSPVQSNTITATTPGAPPAASVTLTVAPSSAGIFVGQSVQGANIPGGDFVTAVAGNVVTLNASTTAGLNGQSVTFIGSTGAIVSTTATAAIGTGTIGSGVPITIANAAGVVVGQIVSCGTPNCGIPAGTTVTAAPVVVPAFVANGTQPTVGASSFTVASTAGILVGQTATAAGFLAAGTKVTSVATTAQALSTTASQSTAGGAAVAGPGTSIVIFNNANVANGQGISCPPPGIGCAIPAGTTLTIVGGANAVPAVVSTAQAANSSSVIITAGPAVFVGQTVAGVGIAAGTTVTAVTGGTNIGLSALTTGAIGVGTPLTFGGTQLTLSASTTAVLSNTAVSITTGGFAIGISAPTIAVMAATPVTFGAVSSVFISNVTTAALNSTPINFVDTVSTLGYPGAPQIVPVAVTGVLSKLGGTAIGTTNGGGTNDAFFAGVQFQDFTLSAPSINFSQTAGSAGPGPISFGANYLLGNPNVPGACPNTSMIGGGVGTVVNNYTAPWSVPVAAPAGTVPALPPNAVFAPAGTFSVTYAGSQSYQVSVLNAALNPGVYVANLTLSSACTDNSVTIQITLNVGTTFGVSVQTSASNLSEGITNGIITPISATPGNYAYIPVTVSAGVANTNYSVSIPSVAGVLQTTFTPNGSGPVITGLGALPGCLLNLVLPGNVNNTPPFAPFGPGPSNNPALGTQVAGPNPGAPSFYIVVNPSTNVAGAPQCVVQAGTYTATINVIPASGTIVQIPFSLTVTPNPLINGGTNAPLVFPFATNTSPTQQQSPQVTLPVTTGGPYSYIATYVANPCTSFTNNVPNCQVGNGTTITGGAGLPVANVGMSQTTGTVAAQQTISLTVTVSPANLTSGYSYGGTITFNPAPGSPAFTPFSIAVVATVGNGLVVGQPASGNLTLTLPAGYASVPAPATILPGGFAGTFPVATGFIELVNGLQPPAPGGIAPTITVNGQTGTLSVPAGVVVTGTGTNPLPPADVIYGNTCFGTGVLNAPCTINQAGFAYFGPVSFNTALLLPNQTYTGAITFTGTQGVAPNPVTTYTAVVNISLTVAALPSIIGQNNLETSTVISPLTGITLTANVGQTTVCTGIPGQPSNGQLQANPYFYTSGGTLGGLSFASSTPVGTPNFITFPITGTNPPIPNVLTPAGALALNTIGTGGPGNFQAGFFPAFFPTVPGFTTQVCVNPQLLGTTPGQYTGNVTVGATGAASVLTVPVTLNLLPTIPSEPGVYRSANGLFILNTSGTRSFNGSDEVTLFMAGTGAAGPLAGDIPVYGDWSGDGNTKIGIYRPSTGAWYLDYNGNGVYDAGDRTYQYGGIAGDYPVVGDWTGTGYSKIGILRGGFEWVLNNSGTGSFAGSTPISLTSGPLAGTSVPSDAVFGFGGQTGCITALPGNFSIISTAVAGACDVPVVGDWSGSGTTKVGVVRATPGSAAPFLWILDQAGSQTFVQPGFGAVNPSSVFGFGGIAGDTPIIGDWNNTGFSKVGEFRGGFLWVVDNNGTAASTPGSSQLQVFPYGGIAGDQPVVGRWKKP